LAKVKNFKDEKETIAIAKTPGHRKKRKVIESLPLEWSIEVHRKIVQYCAWYNHSIRIRYNTFRHTGTCILSACSVSFPEVQSLVEAGRTNV